MPDSLWTSEAVHKESPVLTETAVEAAKTAIECAYGEISEGRLPPWFYERELRPAFGEVVTDGLPAIVANKTTLKQMCDCFQGALGELNKESVRVFSHSATSRFDQQAVAAEAAALCQAGLDAAAATLGVQAPRLSRGMEAVR